MYITPTEMVHSMRHSSTTLLALMFYDLCALSLSIRGMMMWYLNPKCRHTSITMFMPISKGLIIIDFDKMPVNAKPFHCPLNWIVTLILRYNPMLCVWVFRQPRSQINASDWLAGSSHTELLISSNKPLNNPINQACNTDLFALQSPDDDFWWKPECEMP